MNISKHILKLVLAGFLLFTVHSADAGVFSFEKFEFPVNNPQAETVETDDENFIFCAFYHKEENEFSFRNQTTNRQIKKESIRFNFENQEELGTKIAAACCLALRPGYYDILFLHYLF